MPLLSSSLKYIQADGWDFPKAFLPSLLPSKKLSFRSKWYCPEGCLLPGLGVEPLSDCVDLEGFSLSPQKAVGSSTKVTCSPRCWKDTAPPPRTWISQPSMVNCSCHPLFSQLGVAVHLSKLPKNALLTLKMLSLILDKSMLRKTPQLEKKTSRKTESTSFSASQEKDPVSV